MFNAQLLAENLPDGHVNWTPLSVVMTAGTPNIAIQPATRVSVQAVAVIEERGITSIHLVVLSIMAITCVWPSELAVKGQPD